MKNPKNKNSNPKDYSLKTDNIGPKFDREIDPDQEENFMPSSFQNQNIIRKMRK
jgi:hypothetical protein